MKAAAIVAAASLLLSGCGRGQGAAPPAPASTIRFEDVTPASGIRFSHFTGASGKYRMPESVGPGGAFFDYDADGWLDVFLVNSSDWPDGRQTGHHCALYHNNRDGTFTDVTREAGLDASVYGQGCTVGDFDNDGHDDLLVTCVGPNHLFRNLGNGRFQDVTGKSGLDDSPLWAWHTSAAWVDYNRDGLPDLFVCRYVKWSPETDVRCNNGNGKQTYCGPRSYVGDRSELYRNLGGGKFRNVSVATGIASAPGKGLGVVPVDENGDGWVDLFVSNDLVPNFLWRSEGGKRFREMGQESGVAVDMGGKPRAGMGADVADTRNDGGLQFAVGNFSGEGLALFDNTQSLYTDRGAPAGLVPASLKSLTFGLAFLDADRDGWPDLFIYNGHVDPYAQDESGRPIFREAPQIFRNERGTFTDASGTAGAPFQQPQVGRGCAVGDWNNDGRPDLLLCENAGPTRLLRNSSADAHHWMGVHLQGTASGRNSYGAEVRLTAGGVTQRRWVHSGSSFLSHSDSRALFGLGGGNRVDRIEVRWPSQRTSNVENPPIDRYIKLSEPAQ